jgi:hypothetical protein
MKLLAKSLVKPLAIFAACALLVVPGMAAAQAVSPSYPSPSAKPNADGSTTVYFAPVQPAGVMRSNWIQTVPGKGWFVLLQLYGPLEPFYDKSWHPGEIEVAD